MGKKRQAHAEDKPAEAEILVGNKKKKLHDNRDDIAQTKEQNSVSNKKKGRQMYIETDNLESKNESIVVPSTIHPPVNMDDPGKAERKRKKKEKKGKRRENKLLMENEVNENDTKPIESISKPTKQNKRFVNQSDTKSTSTESLLIKKLNKIQGQEPVPKPVEKRLLSQKNKRKSMEVNSGETNDTTKEVIEEKTEKVTIKEKKKEKRKQKKVAKEEAKKINEERSGTAKDASLEYLQQWENKRSEWKFMKVRQVWLLHNMFDLSLVDDSSFEILLRYLEPLKGKSRETTVAAAEKIINALEDKDATDDGENTTKQDRAKQVIQLLSD